MQKLIFEDAWNRTIAIKDRERIKEAFNEVTFTTDYSLQVSTLWQATNHKQEQLVTVIIHNCSESDAAFQNKKICLTYGGEIVSSRRFTLPEGQIDRKTSMPWTFIFPSEDTQGGPPFDKVNIIVPEH